MSNPKTFASLAGAICDVVACSTLYRLFDRPADGVTLTGPALIPWVALTLAVYAACRLFLRKARVLPVVIAFHAVLLGGYLTALLLCFSVLGQPAAYLMAGLMALFTGGRACARCFTPPTEMHSIRQLEACVAILLLTLWFQAVTVLPDPVCLPPLAAVAVAFAALISQRLDGARSASGPRPAGYVSVGLVLAVLAGAMLLFMVFFSAPLGEGVLRIWRALVAAASWAGSLLLRLIVWLFSLLPDPEPGEEVWIDPALFEMGEREESGEGNPVVGAVLLIAFAAGILFLVIQTLWRLRRLKIGGIAAKKTARQQVSRPRFSLWDFLRRLAAWIAGRIRLLWRRFLHRNTPGGVCASIERRGLLLGFARRRGETHCAYLRRAALLFSPSDPALAGSLESLASVLERGFYGGEPMPPLPGREARRLKRQVSGALRRRLLPDADLLARLRLRFFPAASR